MSGPVRAILWAQWRTLLHFRSGGNLPGTALSGLILLGWFGLWTLIAASLGLVAARRTPRSMLEQSAAGSLVSGVRALAGGAPADGFPGRLAGVEEASGLSHPAGPVIRRGCRTARHQRPGDDSADRRLDRRAALEFRRPAQGGAGRLRRCSCCSTCCWHRDCGSNWSA